MKQSQSWEGTLLLFILTFTVLLGVAYNTAYFYHLRIPWFVLLLLSALIAYGIRLLRARKSSEQE